MEITVEYTGQLAGITGETDETVEIAEGTTLKSLLDRLGSKHGEQYSDLLVSEAGELRPSTLVIIDGHQAEGDRGSIVLDEVKTVMLMTPIAGG